MDDIVQRCPHSNTLALAAVRCKQFFKCLVLLQCCQLDRTAKWLNSPSLSHWQLVLLLQALATLANLHALLSPERQSNRWRRGLAARPPVYSCKIQAVCRICGIHERRSKWKKTLHRSDMQQVTPRYDQSCSSVQDLVGTAITWYCFCGMCL
jgi:hypothetical protein